MKVLLTAISFPSKVSGIQRHAFNVVRCLLAHPAVSALHMVIASWQQDMAHSMELPQDDRLHLHIGRTKPDPVARNLWHYISLPRLAEELQPDLIHLSYPVPISPKRLKVPTVLTLHDLYPYDSPANFRVPHVFANRMILQQSLRAATAIACVSDATLSRLKVNCPEHVWKKACRIHNCVEPSLATERPVGELEGIPFLLCVAQHRRNKNLHLLLNAYQRLIERKVVSNATKLLIVGISGPETESLQGVIRKKQLASRVRFVAGLPDAELQWCYAHCEVLVVPSTIEGFGLPVAEALPTGCRIVCSDIPALHEIGREHCKYFELDNNAQINLANRITESLGDEKPPGARLPQLAASFIGQEYIRLYRSVLEEHYATARFRGVEPRRDSTVREM